jgi:protein SCO1/2
MTRTTRLTRRTALRTAGAAAVAGLAGCLGLGDDRPEDVTLAPPDNYDQLQEADLPYPVYGEDLPAAEVPGVVHGRPVSTREFVGERHLLLTFVYTRCTGICLGLGSNLVQVQAAASDSGYTDEVALGAISFDPSYDTPERLREWGAERGFDYDLGNAYLMLPESEQRAQTIVEERFGEAYQYEEGADMPFLHSGLVVLANDRGVVERAYAGEPPTASTIVDDVETLVGG